MGIRDELQAGLKDLEEAGEFGTFEYFRRTFPCIPSTLSRGTVPEIGGEGEEIQFTLIVRKNAVVIRTGDDAAVISADLTSPPVDDLSMPPRVREKLRYRQKDYRIVSVDEDAAGACWRVHLGSLNK